MNELDYEEQELSEITPVNSTLYSALDKIPELAKNFMICITSTFEKKLKSGKVLNNEDIFFFKPHFTLLNSTPKLKFV